MSQVGLTRYIYLTMLLGFSVSVPPYVLQYFTADSAPGLLFSLGNPWDYCSSDSQPPHILYSNNFHKAFSLFVLKVDD